MSSDPPPLAKTFSGHSGYSDEYEFDDDDDDEYDDNMFDADASFAPCSSEDAGMDSGKKDGISHDQKCYKPADILAMQTAAIDETSELLGISRAQAGVLLRFYRWNKEKLQERYFEDPQGECEKAGVNFGLSTAGSNADRDKEPKEGDVCGICFDEDTPIAELNHTGCGHFFCQDCYAQYMTMKVEEGQSTITCPTPDCYVVVDEDLVKACVDEKAFNRYLFFLNRTFVEVQPNLKWCPAPGCENCVYSPLKSFVRLPTSVTCACGQSFCFECGHPDAHAPCTCETLRKWVKKAEDDSETANWLVANTNECPQCHTSIEKNGGCNHMSCRKCKFDFCWLCMGAWKGHTSCNKYVEKDVSKSEAKRMLERYLHYYHRFKGHSDSLKLEGKSLALIEHKMKEMLELNDNKKWLDVQYLRSAQLTVCQCRRVIQYTYVHAYFLPESCDKDLFEYLQEAVEQTLENLSGMLEKDKVEEIVKVEVVTAANELEIRLKNLLDGVERGLIKA
eukprot:GFYU01003744.1.p1 GENE.GFYU01003744.1~~GFYU01003744.1.p1  ORF type:complete len:505 (-),score=117.93 GFYU01003744.1:15-1529(-)